MWNPDLASVLQAGLSSLLGQLMAATRQLQPESLSTGRKSSRLSAHRLTEVGLFCSARQNSIKVTAVQTGIRTDVWIPAAEHIQETFSPNEWVIERESTGWKTVRESRPDIKTPLGHALLSDLQQLFLSSSPPTYKCTDNKAS